jgi:hypothetical protein
MKRRQPEAAIQRAIVSYMAAVAPHVVCYAVPNASRRTKGGRAGNAVPGLTKGVPDLALVVSGRALFLEVKAPKGRTSTEQDATIARLKRAGASVEVVRSIDDVERALTAWGISTRHANKAQWFPVPVTTEQMEDAE